VTSSPSPDYNFNLASIVPHGAGTERVESLYSLTLRLAGRHSTTPNAFVALLGPLTGQHDRTRHDWVGQLHDTSFSGSGDESFAWVNFLERATGMQLGMTIAGRWGHTLTRRGSGSSRRKWCPQCLDDSLGDGDPYLHLLWTIGLVTACPVHGCVLETACPHCGHGRTATGRTSKRFAMHAPGVCGECGGWLGAHDPVDPAVPPRAVTPAADHAICVAAHIGGLLAEPLGEEESVQVGRTLTAAADRYFGGSMVKLADWIGLNKSTVHGWLKGDVVPELGRLVELAIKLRMPLRELMTGNTASLPDSLSEKSARLESYDRSAPNPHLKRAAMEALLDDDPGISVREMARRVGMNHRDAYVHDRNAVIEHSEVRRSVAADIRTIELAEAVEAVRECHSDLIEHGQPVTVRALREVLEDTRPGLSYADQQVLVDRALSTS